MVSITVPLEDEIIKGMNCFPWVNWSEVVREKLIKREIFEEFIRTGDLSKEAQKFCDNIDWYPIDELQLKEEYVEKLRSRITKPSGKSMTVAEFKKWREEL